MVESAELSEAAEKLIPALDALSAKDRLVLAGRLLAQPEAEEPDSPEVRAAWKAVILRRVEEIKSGKVVGIPSEEVFKRMREKYG